MTVTLDANPHGAFVYHEATPYTPFSMSFLSQLVSATFTFEEGADAVRRAD